MVIIGDGAVGKTCLLTRLLNEDESPTWVENYQPTAAATHKWTVDAAGQELQMEVWDTAGQESLAQLRLTSYPGTDLLILAFDTTKMESLDALQDEERGWVKEFEEAREEHGETNRDLKVLMVGTKCDLLDGHDPVTRQKSQEAMEQLRKGGLDVVTCLWTSAKDGTGIDSDKEDENAMEQWDDYYWSMKQIIPAICTAMKTDKTQPSSPAPTPVAASQNQAPAAAEPAKVAAEPTKGDGPAKGDAGCCIIA